MPPQNNLAEYWSFLENAVTSPIVDEYDANRISETELLITGSGGEDEEAAVSTPFQPHFNPI